MSAAERAFFDGDHCHHVAARDEDERLARIWSAFERHAARNHRNAMTPARRAEIERMFA